MSDNEITITIKTTNAATVVFKTPSSATVEDFKKQIDHYWSDKLLETDYFLKVGIIAGKETSPS